MKIKKILGTLFFLSLAVVLFSCSKKTFEVVFYDWDNTVLDTQKVEEGSVATAPKNPIREGYDFLGWNKEYTNITEDIEITATYQINTYTIVWKNHDGSVLATDSNIEWGSTPSYGGTTPTKAAPTEFNYTFIGWSPTVEVATSNQEYVAQFSETIKTYTVIWKNHDGSVLETDQVAYGEVPTYGGLTPIKEKTAQYTYTFSNWEPAISAVNGNQEYTAQFNSTVNSYEVTFKDWDGSELKKETVLYGAEATAPTEPTREGYEFDSWDVAFNNITGDLVVSATYQINTYTIVWKNHDGSVLATDSNIEWGSTPSYGGTTPTKAATAEFNYTFIGWSPTVEVATSNQEYVAQFSETIKTYTVIWKNHDGSVLETDQVAYGEVPTYGGLTPIKEKTAQYTYTFSNWEPAISAVNGNQEYTAQFNSTVNSYEVTFKDWDGSELKKETVLYGAEATAPTEPTREGYEFDSWDVAFNNITGDLVVSATYQINTYTIVWKNHDGSVLATDSNIEWGSTPSYGGTTPTKAATAEFNYTFIGWSPTVEVATSNQEYVAQFSETIKTYTVIWKNHDGSVLETDQVAYGEVPTYGGLTPIKEKTAQYTYTFSNWEPAISAVNGNQEYTAQFSSTVNSYEVTFKDWDGSELKKETVLYGAEATAPTEPTREGYEFDSWDVAFNNITGDLLVSATYQINTYTIVWKNHDGSVLATDSNIEWGSTPSYGGTTPTKAATAEFNYTFIGWSPTVEVATSNQEYVAQFSETIKTYTVIWKNHDGSVLETDQVAYGEVPTYGGLTPIKEKTAQYTYTFSNWEPAISAVNGNQEYTAQFNSTVNSYEVTFKDWDGSELKKETVLYGAEATAPTEPTREGYEFDSWDVAFNNITGDLVVSATYTPIRVNQVVISVEEELDIFSGPFELTATVLPNEALNKTVSFSIVDSGLTGATITNNVLSVLNTGVLIIRAYADGIYSEDFTITIIDTTVYGVEITNTENLFRTNSAILLPNVETEIVLQLFPENAVPKNIQYILQNNTSGATVTDGKITATQSGSVRVYVVVDGVVSDNTFTFNVPIAITNADEFNAIRNNLNGFYMLTNHIDLSNYDWVPIGYAFYNNGALDYSNAFNGYLNGNGYDITGLNINMSNTDYITVGLFGVVGNSAIINDVNIVAGNLYGIANNNTEYVGLLSGLNLGKIRNGSISGTIKIQNGTYIGGVSGQVSSAEISNYDINVDIDVISTGNIYIGLSAGEFLNGTLTNNTVQGSIKLSTSGSAYVGGLVGKASNTVTFSNANVNILITKSGSAFVGGLLGYSDNIYRIENGIAIGNINVASNGSTYVGGIAGSSGNISDSSYDGDVSVTSNGSTYVGGIAGSSGNISDSSYDGDVSVTSNGSTYVGGIAGSSLSLYNVHNYGESISIYINAASSLNSYIGGISGKSSSVELAETNTNLSIVTSGNIFVGGISGESPIVNTNTSGLISVILKGTSGLSYVGGITGRGDVTQSASTSKIYVETLNGYIGGLSGSGNITDSSFAGSEVFVNTTSATGTNYIGGLTGSGNVINSDIDANILVSSKSNVYLGGLTGFGDVGNSLSNVNISFTSDKTSGSHYIGALSAISSSSVSNSSAFYTIEMLTKTGTYVGAIGSGNSISDINASGNINIIDAQVLNVGGVSGNATSINNSTFVGNINTSNSAQTYVGGLVGRISGDVLDSEANAEISVISTAVTPNLYGGIGGLIGFAERNSSIDAIVSNSQSYGSISANIKSLIPVGGLIGYISNQYYTGSTNRSYRLFQVENSYSKVNLIVNNTSTSSASTYVGGLIGQTTSNVLNSYAIGDVNATSSYEIRIGGLIGSLSTAVPITSSIKVTLPILNNSYSAYGLISSDTSPRGTITHIGGLVGYSEGDIKNSYTINYVNGSTSGSTKTLYVGGLVGSNKGVIDSSYTLSAFIYGVREELNDNDVTGIGQLSASVFVGGFVGNNMSEGIITNSYSRATTRIVTAYVGGFVGLNSGLISYSIGYGSITVGSAGEDMVGGFAGSGTDGYYETYYSLPGTSISADKPVGTGLATGITGLTAVQLRSSNTFSNFSNIYWQITNNLQPELQISSLSWEVYAISAVYSVRILKDINNKENQFDYPISDGMIELTLNYNDSENAYSLFVKVGENYKPMTKYRDGYEFLGWFIDANLEIPYEGIITPEAENLYASWQKSYTSGLNYELINNLGWRVSIGSATDVEEIVIPNLHQGIPVLYIGSFANATSLTKIYIPDSVISINFGAFSGNTSLIEMRLPFIGSSASSLTGSSGYLGYIFGASSYTSSSSYIPSSLVKLIVSNHFIIDQQTFYGVFHLEDVIFEETNPIFQSINGVVYNYNLSELVYYPPKKSTIEYPIQNTATLIKSTAFNNYSLSSIIVPNSVTSIGEGAFQGAKVTTLVIPNSVTSIGEGAFQGAYNLTSITLPFVGGSRSASTTVQSSGTVSQYLFGYIFGSTTLTTTANETNLVYQGQRGGSNYRHYYIPSSLTSITITDASGISANAFYGMTNVTSINLNEGITFIGNNAFYRMTGLLSMEVPSSVTSIGTHTWYNNTSLESITLPDVTMIPAYAFYGTSSLTIIDIPVTVSEIYEYAFYNSGLTSLTLPEITTSIGAFAFYGLSGITTLVIPENTQSIGSYAFSGANNVTSLTFNSNVLTTIGSNAFQNIKVTTLVIPNSVTSIGVGAFQGANNLTSITLPFVGGSRSTSTTVQSSGTVSQYLFGYIFGSNKWTTTANATNRVYQGQGQDISEWGTSHYRHYYIPSSLTSITITDASGISANAFYGMTNVTSINLNEGITFIGNNAFYGIEHLSP